MSETSKTWYIHCSSIKDPQRFKGPHTIEEALGYVNASIHNRFGCQMYIQDFEEKPVSNITIETIVPPPTQPTIAIKVKGVELFRRINGKWNYKNQPPGYFYALADSGPGHLQITALLDELIENNARP